MDCIVTCLKMDFFSKLILLRSLLSGDDVYCLMESGIVFFVCFDFSRHSKSVQINRHETDIALLQFEKQFPQKRVGTVVKLTPSLVCTDSQQSRQMIWVPTKG